MVIQLASKMVFLEASPDERSLRIKLYMQTTYSEVIIPHDIPPMNVVEARLRLAVYRKLYDVTSGDDDIAARRGPLNGSGESNEAQKGFDATACG